MTQTPTKSQTIPKTPARAGLFKRHDSWRAGEIIPDSEEERNNSANQVIEISSDESDPGLPPGSWAALDITSATPRTQVSSEEIVKSPRIKIYRGRQIVQSSSEEESDGERNTKNRNDILDLSDSSPERYGPASNVEQECSVTFSEDDAFYDDGAILTLNEPGASRKPFRLPKYTRSPSQDSVVPDSQEPVTPFAILDTPIHQRSPASSFKPVSSSKDITNTKATPRKGKKAEDAAEQERRETFARELFAELNHSIFNDGLPSDTKLNWSKFLRRTAGRAKYARQGSKEGVRTIEIELAKKILVSEDRITRTLAHEMCHLACWVIDENPKEGHGKLFKSWAQRVMRKRPDIVISITHDYEIAHPFNWECTQCKKTYGRFSKSIKTDEVACGVCKGRLTPLFSTRVRKTPDTPKMSRMATSTPNDSPILVSRPATAHKGTGINSTLNDSGTDSDADIVSLTTAIKSVTLGVGKETS